MAFLDDLASKAEQIVNLQIKTIIGEATFDPNDKSGKYTLSDNAQIMYTSINLLDGDITSIVPESFLSDKLSNMRQYHQSREAMGRQIIKDNIECLKELTALIKSLGNGK
ncbi:MAG: hypothetical protein HRT35_00255 [Algicola sp.]|nr:hypothetical protein [Algicola sp.]